MQPALPGQAVKIEALRQPVRRNLMGAFADNGDVQPQPTSGGAVKDNRDGRSVDDVFCRTPPGIEYRATGRRSQSTRRTAPAAEEEPEGGNYPVCSQTTYQTLRNRTEVDGGRVRVCATATGRHRRQGNQRLIQALGAA